MFTKRRKRWFTLCSMYLTDSAHFYIFQRAYTYINEFPLK